MSVLDDIRDGKGLKPITSTYCTCQKGMTNIDVLRNASAVNFARFIACIARCKNCAAKRDLCDVNSVTCAQAWCNWLLQEAET